MSGHRLTRPSWAATRDSDPGRQGLVAIPTWVDFPSTLPPPIPDQLCQLCERDLAELGQRDGLCPDCDQLLTEEDHQAWVDSGGRTCRRCRLDLLPSQTVDGLCPCGGQLL